MTVTMQGKLMSALVNLFYQIWVLFSTFSHYVKSSAHVIFFQNIQHARRIARVRTIVKGQSDLIAGFVAVPQDIWLSSLHCAVKMLESVHSVMPCSKGLYPVLFVKRGMFHIGADFSTDFIEQINHHPRMQHKPTDLYQWVCDYPGKS